ncbi:MAG: LysR substrate-binding domain-containing protein [Roseobacter sp.]|nr:LysR substrate-binding domain-containing protein [Roseobacter sp.]
MRTFAAAAEAGSFTAAAERLGLSKKLVSKYIGQMEDRLGVRLFHRTTRRLSLTDAGARYYPQCVRLIEELDAVEAGLREQRGQLSGNLRVTAPVNFGEAYLQALVQKFHARHPDVTFALRLSDSYEDLADGGYDLALRIGQLEDSSLISKRLASSRLWAVASPAYLGSAPPLEVPADLAAHPCILDTNMRSGTRWPFTVDGVAVKVDVSGPFSVNSPTTARSFVLGDKGIGLIPDYIVAEDVAAGRMTRVLSAFPSAEMTVQLLYLDARYMPLRLRRFIDFVAQSFADMESWQDLLDGAVARRSGV